MSELEAVALSLLVSQGNASPTSLASDKTVIGMSPVGASVDSIPAAPTGGIATPR
jgi:hypothetical protein